MKIKKGMRTHALLLLVFTIALVVSNCEESDDSTGDAQTANITVTPTSGLVVTEGSGTDTFEMSLGTQPQFDVTIAVSSNDAGEALLQGGDSPDTSVEALTLTFTSENWNTLQAVTVIGQDDAEVDGDQTFLVVTDSASSGDPFYDLLNSSDVEVSNTDNDTANPATTAPALWGEAIWGIDKWTSK